MTGPVALVAMALVLALFAAVFLSVGRGRKRRKATRRATAPPKRPGARRASADGRRQAGAPGAALPRDHQPRAIATLDEPLAGMPKLRYEEDDAELTLLTLGGDSEAPSSNQEEHAAVPILYDEEAAVDEPTRPFSLILVSAVGQTDRGRRRRRNEDSYLVMQEESVYAIADGMGGHAGGDIASHLAVDTMQKAFASSVFPGTAHTTVPMRASELVVSIQAANAAIFDRAAAEPSLKGMGTTIVSARFSPNKQRMYVGHVGDSRCYRLRGKQLRRMTTDHTMEAEGYVGPHAANLTRSVGVASRLRVDLIIAKPLPEDVYLLCSDGLSKMLSDERIRDVLLTAPDPQEAVSRLIDDANERGGRDNVTVIVVRAQRPTGGGARVSAATGRIVA